MDHSYDSINMGPHEINVTRGYDTDSEGLTSGDSTTEEDVVESLARTLEESIFDHRKEFFPHGSVDKIITRERVRETLESGRRRLPSTETQESRKAEQKVLDKLADFISGRGKKIFAIMLFSNISNRDIRQAISQFQQMGLDDDNLPLTEDDTKAVFFSDTTKMYRKPWNHVRVKAFCSNQWKFLAPVFDGRKREMALHSNSILPFTKASQRTGMGTFGEVHQVTIHPAHRMSSIDVRTSSTV